MNNIIPKNINYINLEWEMKTPQTEKSKSTQDMYTGIHYQYSSDKEVDYVSFTSDYKEKKIGDIKKMVLFCALGFRSALATKALKEMGFNNVANAEGGFDALKNSGLEVVAKEKK